MPATLVEKYGVKSLSWSAALIPWPSSDTAMRARPLASAEDFFRSAEDVRARVDRARLEDPVPGGLAESE